MKAAIIGAGFVGRAHIEALRRLGIEVAGLLGSSPDRAKEQSRALGIARAYTSLDELSADSSVDAVHVCTPNILHRGESEAALNAGKHVICEKPLAVDSRETAELVELARKQKRAAAVTHNLRFYPLCQEARALVRRGAIGEPRMVHGSYLQDWLLYPSDWNWRLEPSMSGSMRTVADIGTHWLDTVMWITGQRVTELCADLATIVPERERPRGPVETFQERKGTDFDRVKIDTEDYASVLLHFERGLRGAMTVSQVSAGRKNRFWYEIDGSEGSIAWNQERPNTLWIGKRREPNRELIKDPALMTPETRGFAAYPAGHAEGYPDTFVQLFKEFYGYIERGDMNAPRPFPTFEAGHAGLVLCEAIATSARDRKWVIVPTLS
ncbi:MAG TPA: Gfo/Idh/MocA family oxidoreductase [Candidatus Acidoferrum sp.]|nr:Gfo/Idh/MocA family oxidoreductase [Candidatus Acidoferrum sp.]